MTCTGGSCSASMASSTTSISNGTSTTSPINPHKLDNIVALCHFCENHGPRIIMCTQSTPLGLDQGGCVAASTNMRTSTSTDELVGTSLLTDTSSVTHPSRTCLNNTLPKTSSTKSEPLCQGCGWTSKKSGFVSHDFEQLTSYFSSKGLQTPSFFSRVRQSCVRSLSCEVNPGREGPLLFGNDVAGYTFSYGFFLHDEDARGQQRWYSIVIVSGSKYQLMSSFGFLTKTSKTIVDRLKLFSLQPNDDVANVGVGVGVDGSQVNPGEQMTQSSAGIQFHLPRRNILRRPSSDTNLGRVRSLGAIIGHPDACVELHKQFIWCLKGIDHQHVRIPVINLDSMNKHSHESKSSLDASFSSRDVREEGIQEGEELWKRIQTKVTTVQTKSAAIQTKDSTLQTKSAANEEDIVVVDQRIDVHTNHHHPHAERERGDRNNHNKDNIVAHRMDDKQVKISFVMKGDNEDNGDNDDNDNNNTNNNHHHHHHQFKDGNTQQQTKEHVQPADEDEPLHCSSDAQRLTNHNNMAIGMSDPQDAMMIGSHISSNPTPNVAIVNHHENNHKNDHENDYKNDYKGDYKDDDENDYKNDDGNNYKNDHNNEHNNEHDNDHENNHDNDHDHDVHMHVTVRARVNTALRILMDTEEYDDTNDTDDNNTEGDNDDDDDDDDRHHLQQLQQQQSQQQQQQQQHHHRQHPQPRHEHHQHHPHQHHHRHSPHIVTSGYSNDDDNQLSQDVVRYAHAASVAGDVTADECAHILTIQETLRRLSDGLEYKSATTKGKGHRDDDDGDDDDDDNGDDCHTGYGYGHLQQQQHHQQQQQQQQQQQWTLRDIHRLLGEVSFKLVVHNVAVGNQCVVRGPNTAIVTNVINAIVSVLPQNAPCNVVVDMHAYRESYAASFLGTSTNVSVPHTVPTHRYVCIDVRNLTHTDRHDDTHTHTRTHTRTRPRTRIRTRTHTLSAVVVSPLALDKNQGGGLCDTDSYSSQMCAFFRGTDNSVIMQRVESVGSVGECECDELALTMVKERWMSVTSAFFLLSHASSTVAFEKLETFLVGFGLTGHDIPVLRFFTSALDRQVRRDLLMVHVVDG